MSSNKIFVDQIDLNYDAENIGASVDMSLSFLKSSIRDGLFYDDEYVLASSYFAKLSWNIQSNTSYHLLDVIDNYLVPITEKVTITSALSNYTISPRGDLYVTLSLAGGTIGDSSETGYTVVIDAATLGGYCNSVFYQNLPI